MSFLISTAFIGKGRFINKAESYREKYNKEFFMNHDLVNVDFEGSVHSPERLDVAVRGDNIATVKIIYQPWPYEVMILPVIFQSISTEVEKGLLDNMTSGRLISVYLD